MRNKKTILIAGGGTGGHIYPAIAIGRALQKANPEAVVGFIGTRAGLEQKIMARENLQLEFIHSGKLNYSGNPFLKLKSVISIAIGFVESIVIILRRKPEFVLGVGGYASAPFLLAAALLGCKCAIWEPNAHPGMANRILSRFVAKAYLVFADAQKYLKSKNNEIVGMPLREEIEMGRAKAKTIDSVFRILCTGGSQGSVFLNKQLSDFVLQNPQLHSQIHVVHQTGTLDFESMKKKYAGISCVEVHEFIYNMPEFYKKSDMQFCRGGASTIAEAACFGVIPVVVPLPAADNHQQSNAEALIKNSAGYMILQNEFKMEQLKNIVTELMTDAARRDTMITNLRRMSVANAADTIAADIFKEIGL